MKKKILISLFVAVAILSMVATPLVGQTIAVSEAAISPKVKQVSQESGPTIKVLIQTNTRNYRPLTSQITSYGGKVTQTFKYAKGIAAEIPVGLIDILQTNANIIKISLDEMRYPSSGVPKIVDLDHHVQGDSGISFNSEGYEMVSLSRADLPETHFNILSMGATGAWDEGYYGQGSLCVIIDTGVYADHIMLNYGDPSGPVIGGIDLSPDVGGAYEGWNKSWNHWHGTHCAGIFAGAAGLILPNDDLLVQSWEQYSGLTLPAYDADNKLMALYGMAPLAQIYGIKVFPHTGAGVSESYIINAIEYAIWMHEEGGYDVDIISMSLGGGTGYDGRDLEDQTVDYATSIGIAVSTSNGNDGPASMTTGSPATALTSITAAAAAHPVNTKLYWDYYYNQFGIGDYLFTSDTPQIYAYSSRGPTGDGRCKPTLAATGMLVLSAMPSEANPQGLGWASGTSMACPAVSGAIALLNSWGEAMGATPMDYKRALQKGADWLPGYDKYDQGAGYLNAWESMQYLMSHRLGLRAPKIRPLPFNWPLPSARPKGINTRIYGCGDFTYSVDLQPGMAKHFYFYAPSCVESIRVEISDVDYGVDPLGMNSFEVYIQSPIRSSYGYYVDSANVWGDAWFELRDFSTTYDGVLSGVFTDVGGLLQPGYWRVVLENDWTSYDSVSGTIKISVRSKCCWWWGDRPDERYYGKLKTGDAEGWFPVGFGPNGVQLELWWLRDWRRYSTSDLDMIVVWNAGGDDIYEYAGASYNSPEGILINSPNLQYVYVLIDGYETYGFIEPWWLNVYYL